MKDLFEFSENFKRQFAETVRQKASELKKDEVVSCLLKQLEEKDHIIKKLEDKIKHIYEILQ